MKKEIEMLQEHLERQPVTDPEFFKGEIVRLNNGCLGIVQYDTDVEGRTPVYYIRNGEIKGPSDGWELERVDL